MNHQVSEELSEGWVDVPLKSELVTSVQPGFACGANNREGDGVAHLRPMNVSTDGQIELSDLKFVPASAVDRDERWVRRGDVLFNNTNSPKLVGKTAHYDEEDSRAFSNHMTRVRCRTEVLEPRYCALLLHHRWQTGYFESICNNHVSQASISQTVLLETQIALAPLAEQRRIVAKVEALRARVQAARNRLNRVPRILKRFRQAVLTAACNGELTADWREVHPEAAQDLAKEIDRLSRRRPLEWKRVLTTRYKPPKVPDQLCSLKPTDHWAEVSLDSITSLITSGSRAWSQYYGRGTGTFIMAQNVKPFQLDLSSRQAVDPPLTNRDRTRSQVREGDNLVTIVGANTGDVCKVPHDLPEHYVCQSVALLRPVDPLYADYLCLYLNSESHGRGEFLRYIYGEGRPHLGFDQIKMTKVLLPSLAEQHEIVCRVAGLFKLADAIECRVAAATARADRLTQAILAKAFQGQLVPTEAELARAEDRDYETATELLATITATSSTSNGAARPRRPRRTHAKKNPG